VSKLTVFNVGTRQLLRGTVKNRALLWRLGPAA
jgi:hypothetical protein